MEARRVGEQECRSGRSTASSIPSTGLSSLMRSASAEPGPVRGMRPSAPAAGLPPRRRPLVGCRDISWRDGRGRRLRQRLRDEDLLARVRITKVVLAAAHRDHDTANNEDANLAAFCQRCHMLHDRDEHQRRRWRTLFRRKAMGDLFQGPYLAT